MENYQEKVEKAIKHLIESYTILKELYDESDPEYLLSDLLTLINQVKEESKNKF